MDFFYIYGHFPIQYILYVHFPLWTFSDSSNFYGHFITMDNSPYGFFTHRFWIPRSKQLYDCVSFWCKFCYVERNLPSLVWNKVKVFKNVGATVVVPVAPVVTSLKYKRFLDYFGRSVFNFKLFKAYIGRLRKTRGNLKKNQQKKFRSYTTYKTFKTDKVLLLFQPKCPPTPNSNGPELHWQNARFSCIKPWRLHICICFAIRSCN